MSDDGIPIKSLDMFSDSLSFRLVFMLSINSVSEVKRFTP